jgi:hypothetical protein
MERSLIRRGGFTSANAAGTQSPTEHRNLGVQGLSLQDWEKSRQFIKIY